MRKKTQDEYIKEVAVKNPTIEVDDLYINADTSIWHKCKVCQYRWKSQPNHILEGHICPVCAGNIIGPAPEYRNSIWASEYRNYFERYLSEEQMKSYTPHSGKKINIPCPDCGKNKDICIAQLASQGFGCSCGDGQTYPNKFIYALLNQLNIEYIPEYYDDWSDGRKYDIYIPSLNCIIENHGEQHYGHRGAFKKKSLEEEKHNDAYKKMLAEQNGIKHYVVLDCRESNVSWIKKSIIDSELPILLSFNINNIDWVTCHRFALSNIVKQVAIEWENGCGVQDIMDRLHISRTTTSRYLTLAAEQGWCSYTPRKGYLRGCEKRSGVNNTSARPVYCVDKHIIFNYIAEACRALNISSTSNIGTCCVGERDSAGGYQWKYVYDVKRRDGTIIPGAISLNLITEEEALAQLNTQQND